MDLSAKPARWHYALRHFWQRRTTDLPTGVAAWGELFDPVRDALHGVFHARPGFSGVLRCERGRPFTVEPIRYHGVAARLLPSDDRRYFTCEPERVVYALSEAGVYTQNGVVYDPQSRQVIAETLESWEHDPARHPMFAAPGFPRHETLPGRSFLLGRTGSDTFYHFLLEALPPLLFARDFVAACDHILVPDGGREWKLRWLTLAGVDVTRVRWLSALAHLRCEQLVFTSRMVRHFEPNPWAVSTIRALVPLRQVQGAANSHALWLDRTSMPARRVSWEPDLVARLRGFDRVSCDTLAPDETAVRLAGARVLAGFHGAAFANMVFAAPGARVIELLTRPNFPWYGRLSQLCGHRHVAVRVDDAPASLNTLSRLIPELADKRTEAAIA